MGAHLQAAFFKAGGKKDREAWRWLEPLEIEQRVMAWGYTKVAQRAKKRFRQLHTPESEACRQESRGAPVRLGMQWLRGGGIWGLPFGVFPLEHTLRSLVTLFCPYHYFLAILSIRATAGPAPGTVGHLLTCPEPSLGPCSRLGACLVRVSSHEWRACFFHPETRWNRLFRAQAHPIKGTVGSEWLQKPSSLQITSPVPPKHSLQLNWLSLLFIAADLNM